jgi:hypothetical protein
MDQDLRGNMKLGVALAVAAVLLATLAVPARAQKSSNPAAAGSDEFFIISSLDLKKDQLVLKRPTEVTVLMDANDKTVCLDEKGKPLHLKDLRAGDTVFVTYHLNPEGVRVATRIRMGYMTPDEVHRHYMGSAQE